MRKEIVEKIKGIFKSLNTDILPLSFAINSGDFPVIVQGTSDDGTYTLDSVKWDGNGAIMFDGSSSYDNAFWWDYDLDIETLLEIEEYLEEHYGDIAEYLDGDDM